MMRETLKKSQRIVVKAGTSILSSEGGIITSQDIARLGKEILSLLRHKNKVALVSSGAIAFGMQALGLEERPRPLAKLQACAAIGQSKLMHAYESFFSIRSIVCAQLLLTRDGLENPERFLAARHTVEELFSLGVLPIINENDTVATEEITFGDNDILSVQVAHLIHADLLVLLSDVDGFYLKDGSRIREVPSASEIDGKLARHLKDTQKEKTVGGMKAKLAAAGMAMKLGVPLLIASGHQPGILESILKGEDVGTLFLAEGKDEIKI